MSAEALKQPYDLVLLSCKAYDLDGAMTSFAPAVGPGTAILPLLNGLAHLDALAGRFAPANVHRRPGRDLAGARSARAASCT